MVDDKFTKFPIVGIVSADTKAPVESVKFISFLTRDDIHAEFFSKAGMLSTNASIKEAELLFDKNIASKFNTDFKTSTPLFLKEEQDYYLVNSILNSEFWTAHLNKSMNSKELLEKATFLAKAILAI